MTCREAHPGNSHRIHALRPTRGDYQTWCGQLVPEQPSDVVLSDKDKPCSNCLEALAAEVVRNEQALSHA